MSLRAMVSGIGEPDLPFFAVRTLEVELSEPLPTILGRVAFGTRTYVSARVLVRLHHQPMGFVDVDLSGGPASPAEWAPRIWDELGPAILAHLSVDGVSPAGEADRPTFPIDLPCELREEQPGWRPLVSVVICTLNRPRQLQNALDALLALSYPQLRNCGRRQWAPGCVDREHDPRALLGDGESSLRSGAAARSLGGQKSRHRCRQGRDPRLHR